MEGLEAHYKKVCRSHLRTLFAEDPKRGERFTAEAAGIFLVPRVHAVLDKMSDFCNRVRSSEWKGFTGKRIRNVVNVGIGGSDLGPVMAYEVLRHYSERALTFRFVSNIDGTDFAEAVRDLHPEELSSLSLRKLSRH